MEIYQFPKWDEIIEIETFPVVSPGVIAVRDFIIRDANNKTIAKATSGWIIIDYITRRPQKLQLFMPDNSQFAEKSILEGSLEKLGQQPEKQLAFTHTVQLSDLDANGHVNSGKYLQMIYDALPLEILNNFEKGNCAINFQNETRLGEQIQIFIARNTGKYAIEGIRKNDEKPIFIAEVNI